MKRPTLFLLSSLFIVTTVIAQETLTLHEAVQAALKYNHSIQIQTIETEKAENRITRGNAGQLPTIALTGAAEGSYSDQELTPGTFFQALGNSGSDRSLPTTIEFNNVQTARIQAGVGAEIIIYNGGKGNLQYRMLETGGNLANLRQRSEMEQTVLSVTRRYIESASLKNALGVKELSLRQSLNRYRTLEIRREYGQAEEQLLLQALADLKSDSTEHRDLTLQYETARRELNRLIGWQKDITPPLSIDISLSTLPSHENLLNAMLQNNTTLDVAEMRLEQARLNRDISGADFLPTVTGSAQYGYHFLSATDGQFERQKQLGFTGGLNVRIPIFSGGRNRTRTENARASIRQENLRKEDTESQLLLQFENQWQEYHHRKEQFETERTKLKVFERNYERAKESFDQGLITGLDLRNAQLSLEQARLRLTDVRFRLILAHTTLQYLSGTLVTGEKIADN